MFIAPLGTSLQCETGNITLIIRKISVMEKYEGNFLLPIILGCIAGFFRNYMYPLEEIGTLPEYGNNLYLNSQSLGPILQFLNTARLF